MNTGMGDATARVLGPTGAGWTPTVGNELTRLLDAKFHDDPGATRSVRDSTLRILARCVDPSARCERASNTGLVVGYVQSGKTLSFTAVAAAAHDNGFRCVVVIAGSSLNLADQNRDRLAGDLGIGQRGRRPRWRRAHNATIEQHEQLMSALRGWDHDNPRTLLLTALKHHRHIQNLGDLLGSLGDAASPMLIIDDEADQVSLNSRVNQGAESANYGQILGLRARAPHHTYLQYTATPQANIFIPLWDLLSPQFCEVLEPGSGYVGGHRLFVERRDDLVRVIPTDDLQRCDDLALDAPPTSLFSAMRAFFLGVANGLVEERESGQYPPPGNRSMMVHPAREQIAHQVFKQWIDTAKGTWRRTLADPHDRETLVGAFRAEYDDLASTDRGGTLRPFDELMRVMPQAIGQTQVREVNARSSVDRTDWSTEWSQDYSWILVGGQSLDRGFTVEGLTVTYMPRDIGTRQADTIQQRARFFGYKRGYEDLCRVYLDPTARRAFEAYVRHERSMRSFLERHRDRLAEPTIPREFELDPQLRPTREAVLVDSPDRLILQSGWLFQRGALARPQRCAENGRLLQDFLTAHGGAVGFSNPTWVADPSGIRRDHVHTGLAGVPLRDLYERVLAGVVLPDPEEHSRWQMALWMIANAIEQHDGLLSNVVVMRPESAPFRGVDDERRIKTVFAGAHPSQRPYAYLGDREVRLDDVTLQWHRFDLGRGDDGSESAGRDVEERRVTVLALWLGEKVNRPMIRQTPSPR